MELIESCSARSVGTPNEPRAHRDDYRPTGSLAEVGKTATELTGSSQLVVLAQHLSELPVQGC